MAFIKCQNCGGVDFQPTTIGTICATEGRFHVNAYACQNCGHIELFEPSLDSYAKHLRKEAENKRQQEALERQKKEESERKHVS